MSRLYEALQRSQQGESSSASPLSTPIAPEDVPGAQIPGLPLDDTAALDALTTQAPPPTAAPFRRLRLESLRSELIVEYSLVVFPVPAK